MKDIVLENVYFYGDNLTDTLTIPDDMVFVEVNRYKVEEGVDKQRFYAAFYPYDENLYKSISASNCKVSAYNVLNTWLYIEIHNAYPINEDLPLISMEEFNDRYLPWFKKYIVEYVGTKKITEEYYLKMLESKMLESIRTKGELFDDTVFTEFSKDSFYTIYMDKILRFCGHDEYLLVEVANVNFKSWVNENDDIKNIQVVHIRFNRLLTEDLAIEAKYVFQDSKEAWKKYEDRKQEILNYCNE